MTTPFDNLPFNKIRSYVMGVTPTKCEIYIPVLSNNEEFMIIKREELQKFLNEYCEPEKPIEPMLA